MQKILIIRFSSIGDIILTTPVIRCLKQQLPDISLHYLTKANNKILLQDNPYIDQLILLENSLDATIQELKAEKYDYIIDLHHNQRTWWIKRRLGIPSYAFYKANMEKWMMVQLKWNRLPKKHIVDRYLETLTFLGIKNDGMGLDYFIPDKDKITIKDHFEGLEARKYIALVIGAKHFTKRLPNFKLVNLCRIIQQPIILLGGKEDRENGAFISQKVVKQVYNACGRFNLNQSASIIQQAAKVISHDTGLMHIAAAFDQEIYVIWGNTIPDFGMHPYLSKVAKKEAMHFEVKNLTCRPCSKIGKKSCPKKHFRCMELIDECAIADAVEEGNR